MGDGAEGSFGVPAGENFADGGAVGFERLAQIGREEMAVPDEEEVGLGGGAERTRCSQISGAVGAGAVGGAARDFGQGTDDGLEVAAEDMGEHAVQVDEVKIEAQVVSVAEAETLASTHGAFGRGIYADVAVSGVTGLCC